MSIQEAQTPLPAPPTGASMITALHEYNPENGHYEPSIRGFPRNVDAVAPLQSTAFLLVVANAPVWFYHFVFANSTATAEDVALTEPGGNVYRVTVPADDSITIVSTPSAPLFVCRTAGNIMINGAPAGGAIRVTAAYVVK